MYAVKETGFYYLQSRYYDPTLGRFINADSYASTGQGFLGYNMFAYCNNNPANGDDPTGHSMDWTREAYSFGTSGAGESCAGGGSGGIGDIIWAIIQILKELTSSQAPACIDALPYTIPSVETKSISDADVKVDKKENRLTFIYRYYATRTTNLAPRPGIDNNGLSFSLIPPTRQKQYPVVVTTLEAVNATGILTYVKKGDHVSIVPTNATVAEWMAQGQNSYWSSALSEIVIQLGG